MLGVLFLYRRNTLPDQQLVAWLERELASRGFGVLPNPGTAIGLAWARETERLMRRADAVIPLLSPLSVRSEMLHYEVLVAYEVARERGRPWLLPLRVQHTTRLPETLNRLLDQPGALFWRGADDNERLVQRLLERLGPLAGRWRPG